MHNAEELYQNLIEPIEKKMTAIVARIVRDPDQAADVFQEILAEIWAKLAKIDNHPNPHAYILRICIGRSYDALRKRARINRREAHLNSMKARLLPDRSAAVPEMLGTIETIRTAVAQLPTNQGRALLLRTVNNSDYCEIANILGCSEVTARSHIAKARARLRQIMQKLNL
ncbi:MAG: RNA polymerase sigma factor [Sedimentisphaerales bacterium]|nr:RNA polymerase sigma factor [Sedimentisphaerales bacterium]